MAHQIYPAIADGILGGGVYALMAVGLTLIFGVLDIINVAQGILVVVGGYLSYVLSVHLHIDLFLGLLITIPAMFVLGLVIHTVVIRPLHGPERTSMSLLACFAVAIILEGALYWIFGPNAVTLTAFLHQRQRQGGRVLHQRHLPVLLRAGDRPGGGDLPAAVPVPFRQRRTGHDAGRDRRPARRHRR